MQLTLENMESYLSLFGMNDRNMAALEQELNVSASLRGQELALQGDARDVEMAEELQMAECILAIGFLCVLCLLGLEILGITIWNESFRMDVRKDGSKIHRMSQGGAK